MHYFVNSSVQGNRDEWYQERKREASEQSAFTLNSAVPFLGQGKKSSLAFPQSSPLYPRLCQSILSLANIPTPRLLLQKLESIEQTAVTIRAEMQGAHHKTTQRELKFTSSGDAHCLRASSQFWGRLNLRPLTLKKEARGTPITPTRASYGWPCERYAEWRYHYYVKWCVTFGVRIIFSYRQLRISQQRKSSTALSWSTKNQGTTFPSEKGARLYQNK